MDVHQIAERRFVIIRADDVGVTHIAFASEKLKNNPNTVAHKCAEQLNEYLKGNLKEFAIEIHECGSEFQKMVWAEVRKVRFGHTRSYKDIAIKVRGAHYSRCVGTAIGKNPIAIVTPCHRIIASDGGTKGYAWGVSTKSWLLEHESRKRHHMEVNQAVHA